MVAACRRVCHTISTCIKCKPQKLGQIVGMVVWREHMSDVLIMYYIHAVFGTKDRGKIINKEIQPHLWSYMEEICRKHRIAPIAINGMEDHAHIFFSPPPELHLAGALNLIKTNSSKWMSRQGQKF